VSGNSDHPHIPIRLNEGNLKPDSSRYCCPSYTGSGDRRTQAQAGPCINARPYLKNTYSKRAMGDGGPSGSVPAYKCEAMSSNPSTRTKQKNPSNNNKGQTTVTMVTGEDVQ
jgi:hypothetical protein